MLCVVLMIKRVIQVRELLLVLLISIFSSQFAKAQTPAIPVEVQFQIFFKILSFDKNINKRGADGLNILIVYQKKYRSSLALFNDINTMLEDSSIKSINKIPVRFHFVNIDETTISSIAKAEKINLIYLCPLRGVDITDITLFTRENDILSFTGISEYVYAGISVGVELKNQKPQIIINLNAAKEELADFSSQLLRISKIISEGDE